MNPKIISEEDLNKAFDNEHHKLAKSLQIFAGLWPFQTNFQRKFRRIVIFIPTTITGYTLVRSLSLFIIGRYLKFQ